MEEDLQNYSPIVMFRGTPCTQENKKKGKHKKRRQGEQGGLNGGKDGKLSIIFPI